MSSARVIKILSVAAGVYILQDALSRNGIGLEQLPMLPFIKNKDPQSYSDLVVDKGTLQGCNVFTEDYPKLGALPVVDCNQANLSDAKKVIAKIYTSSQREVSTNHQSSFFVNLVTAGIAAAGVCMGQVVDVLKGRCRRNSPQDDESASSPQHSVAARNEPLLGVVVTSDAKRSGPGW